MLAQAQNEKERVEIEQKMQSDGELLAILHALQAIDKEDLVTEERSRRDQARKSRVAADIEAMDTDDTQVVVGNERVGSCKLKTIAVQYT